MKISARRIYNNANDKKKIEKKIIVRIFIFFATVFSFIILSAFKPLENKYLKNPPHIKDTIYVYDTVVYYDTTYIYDTIYTTPENKISNIDSIYKLAGKLRYGKILMQDSDFLLIKKIKQNKRKKLQLFSLDFLFSPVYSDIKFSDDIIYHSVAEKNNDALTPSLGSTFSVNLNWHHKSSIFTSGINLTSFNTDFSAISAKYEIDTVIKEVYTPVVEMHIDSVQFINIDTLLATGDTLYYYIVDTTYNTYIDTSNVQTLDTSAVFYDNKTRNKSFYIDIPLIYSRNFYFENFNLTPEIGFITSFFVNSEGKIISLTNLFQTDDLKYKPEYAAVNLSLYVGIKTNYILTDKFDFITSAYFRRSINSIFSEYPLISRFNSLGITVGLRYKFLF